MPVTLRKSQIVDAVHEQALGFNHPRTKSVETVETLLEMIKRALESGDDVLISGFGKFCVHEKKERRGRNPATGEEMVLAPRKVISFKCSSNLRNKVNGIAEKKCYDKV